jgi:hypothetical protein
MIFDNQFAKQERTMKICLPLCTGFLSSLGLAAIGVIFCCGFGHAAESNEVEKCQPLQPVKGIKDFYYFVRKDSDERQTLADVSSMKLCAYGPPDRGRYSVCRDRREVIWVLPSQFAPTNKISSPTPPRDIPNHRYAGILASADVPSSASPPAPRTLTRGVTFGPDACECVTSMPVECSQ